MYGISLTFNKYRYIKMHVQSMEVQVDYFFEWFFSGKILVLVRVYNQQF